MDEFVQQVNSKVKGFSQRVNFFLLLILVSAVGVSVVQAGEFNHFGVNLVVEQSLEEVDGVVSQWIHLGDWHNGLRELSEGLV